MGKIRVSDFKDKVINMHTHTTRCQHAKGQDREYVEKAIVAGYEVLGFSDHAPYLYGTEFVSPMRMKMSELEGYVDSVLSLKKEYEKDIDIYCGLEMEYFPQHFVRTIREIDNYPIDYLLLGQHYYDDENGKISPKNGWEEEERLAQYIERVMAGLATERFFYVAHPDLMCFKGDVEIYRKHMMPLVQELKRRDMPIEINMNGLRCGLHYPTPEFVKMGVENGNNFVIGVDAHAPGELLDFECYEKCKQLVLNYGGILINNLKAYPFK